MILTYLSWLATLCIILSYYTVTSKAKKRQLKFLTLTLVGGGIFALYYYTLHAYSGMALQLFLMLVTTINYLRYGDETT